MSKKDPLLDEWRTPKALFDALDLEFDFNFDAAADATNHLCPSWTDDIANASFISVDRIFCNPPYSNIEPFVNKALSMNNLWVFILPTRMRARWMERLRNSGRCEFRWFTRRIAFDPPPGVNPSSPRMDTFVAIVRPK